MERSNKYRKRNSKKARKPPKVPIKTYRWEDIRRAKRRGGYPWTHLYKRPFSEKVDSYPFTMDALRRSKSASTMGARSDGVEISEISSFAGSGATTPSLLHPEYITEPKSQEDISTRHSHGSLVIEEYLTEDEKDLEDDVQIKEFRTGSAASSDNISQYLDKEERDPGNSNTKQDNENDEKLDSSADRDKRAKSEETAKRKRKLSAESSYSRYSLSRLGVIKKLKEAKDKIKIDKIKVPKISFPTKNLLKKRNSPPKDIKKEKKKKTKKETKKFLEPSKLRRDSNPVYIHIPLKPPSGETDEFSHLEFETKKAVDKKLEDIDEDNKENTPKSDEKLVVEKNEKTDLDITENKELDNKEDEKKGDNEDNKRKSPFSSLERGPRVTKKPPLVINPAFKQFLKDVRQLKEKETTDEPTDSTSENVATENKDPNLEVSSKDEDVEKSKLDDEEHLDLEEQQTSDGESPKEDDSEKLFEASADTKETVPKEQEQSAETPSSSSRQLRSKSAEPQRKRRSSIDSSYSRKSLSKVAIIKKLKEAKEKIKGAFSFGNLKGGESKRAEMKEKPKKIDEKPKQPKKHKLTVQEELAQLGKPKFTEPVYIHIPLKPPPGETDEFSYLENEPLGSTLPKKEERTDSLDSASPVSQRNHDIQFIFLTPPSDDEILEKDPDLPETPSSEDSPVCFGTLKRLAERAIDQVSPETRRKQLETVREESVSDRGSGDGTELTAEAKEDVKEAVLSNEDQIKAPPSESVTGEDTTSSAQNSEDDQSKNDETVKSVEVEKMIVDVEDGLNEPPKTEELKSALKHSEGSSSPVLKKKVSFKRKTKPTKTKTDVDNGYEPIETPKDEKTVNLLEQAGIVTEKTSSDQDKAAGEDIKDNEGSKKKIFVDDVSQSMSVDEEKAYLDQKIIKDTSLEEDYNNWSKSSDHEYEPINPPPDEITVMTSSVLPGVTVINTDNEPKVVISATEILDKPVEEKKKSFFQFGRFTKDKGQGDARKSQVSGGVSDDRSKSSEGQDLLEESEQKKPNEGPNKFQAAFRQRTDQLKTKADGLRNKVRNIKKPNIQMPKAPEFKKPEFKKPNFKKPDFKKPDFKKFKIEKPKINLYLPKIPDTATIHLPHISLPGAKKSTETRTIETRQYSTESNAGDSGSPKPRSKFDFSFSSTFPRFKKKKKSTEEQFGTTPRTKKNKDGEKVTSESSTSSIRIPLHSEDSMDAEERLNFDRENPPIRRGYDDRETSEDIDRSSRRRYDSDIAIDDEYERENQEINRAEYLNRWQHGNLRPLERPLDEYPDGDERIVEQLIKQRFKKVGPEYGGASKRPEAPYEERYEEDETLEDRLRRDEERPRYYDEDEEEFDQRVLGNKDLITDLDNLEDENGVQIRDGYSSEGSVNLQKKGRLGKLDINSDEFFVVHEIREGFQTPANALAQMNEYDPIGSNRSLPQAMSKRKPIKKPKRKKTPHVSQEEIPGDEESVEDVTLPSRPKRKSKKNKKKPDNEDGIIPYQKTIHLEQEDEPLGQRLEFPRESLGILGDDERDDHEFEMYENERMKGKEQPEILVTDPYKDFQVPEHKLGGRKEVPFQAEEPTAPPRRHRSLKSLTQSENESILTDKFDERPINIEDYIIPSDQIQEPPRRPSRQSRSHTSSLSRVSLPPSQRDTDSILTDEAYLAENQSIPSYLIENQNYKQQYHGTQEVPSYMQDDQPMQPCVEEPCVSDLRDYMGYSIVDKSRQREPPLPPPRTPPRRRKRQVEPEQKFATVPRNLGSSQPEANPPVRPLRNYSTLSQVQSSKKDTPQYENDKENKPSNVDIGQYIEIEEELNRDLVSGDVVQKMRQRPLPAPPRPPRKTKTTRRSLQDITSRENMLSSSSPQDLKPAYIEEETVSTQTEPLPPDFVCEEVHQEPMDTIITARVSENIMPASQKREIPEPQIQRNEQTEPLIKRELITPTVYSYEETVTHGSLLVEPLNGAKILPDHQLSRERLVPVNKEYSDEETSEVPESFRKLKNPEEVKESERSPGDTKKPLEVLKTEKLQVCDLDVDRLCVNELLASKIVVSEIDSSSISTNDIQGRSGALRIGEIELPPGLLEEIVKKLEELRPRESQSEELEGATIQEKKTSIVELPPEFRRASTEGQIDVGALSEPLVNLVQQQTTVEPHLEPSSPLEPSVDIHDRLENFQHSDEQPQSTLDIQEHELSPEPPVPPPRSYTLEESAPDAPPRTIRRKSKDSSRVLDQINDQSDSNVYPEKTDQLTPAEELPRMEMLEPDIDEEPPPRPPEPLESLYMPSQPPASFYALRAKQYVGLDNDNIPTVPRRRKHHRNRSRPVSRSRSTSDESSVTQSHPQTRSPRTSRRFSEPSIGELSGRLIQACGSRINSSLKRLIYHLTENIFKNADGKQDLHVFMIILLVLIAGLILLGYGEDKTVVHLHHWEYFNPPKDL